MWRNHLCAVVGSLSCLVGVATAADRPKAYDEMIARQAEIHGVPEALVHRIVKRESRYQPGLVHRHCFGLMQIKYATAREMGYKGAAIGLLDPKVNLTYAVPYLANAYRLADGDEDRAVTLFSSGYYYTAHQKKMLATLRTASSPPVASESLPPEPEARLYCMDAREGVVTSLKEEHENSASRIFSNDRDCLAPIVHSRRAKGSVRPCRCEMTLDVEDTMGRGEDKAIVARQQSTECSMSQPNNLRRYHTSSLIAVVEMSQSSWLVAGIVPGILRQPAKKLKPDQMALLGLLRRWQDEAAKAGRRISRLAVAFEAGRDGFWLARWLRHSRDEHRRLT